MSDTHKWGTIKRPALRELECVCGAVVFRVETEDFEMYFLVCNECERRHNIEDII